MLQALHELLQALRQGKGAWMPHNLARSYFLAIMNRPLLRAFFLADSELLGRLVRPGNTRENRHRLVSHTYFGILAEHGQHLDVVYPHTFSSCSPATGAPAS